jgi:hypothetical protein
MKLSERRSAWCRRSLQQAPEHFHNSRGVERRQRQGLSFRSEYPIGNH